VTSSSNLQYKRNSHYNLHSFCLTLHSFYRLKPIKISKSSVSFSGLRVKCTRVYVRVRFKTDLRLKTHKLSPIHWTCSKSDTNNGQYVTCSTCVAFDFNKYSIHWILFSPKHKAGFSQLLGGVALEVSVFDTSMFSCHLLIAPLTLIMCLSSMWLLLGSNRFLVCDWNSSINVYKVFSPF